MMRARQDGMSLIEMMVAVTIGMIGIIIIMQAYLTGETFNRSTLGEGSTQTNGLVALYTIERDMRTAGYGINSPTALACGNLFWRYGGSTSANAGGALPNVAFVPVHINVDTVSPSTPDSISVMYSTQAARMMPTKITVFTSSSPVTAALDGNEGFLVNDYVVLAGAAGCSLARVTATASVGQTVTFNVSDVHNPGTWGPPFPGYAADDFAINMGQLVRRTYSIGNNKLRMSESLLQTGVATPVDVVDYVVDMRAVYGKDNGSGGTANDGVVDQYSNVAPANAAEWAQVLGIKVGVLLRNANFEKPAAGGDCDATTVQPTWSQGTFLAIDVSASSPDRCYRYRVFETTIPLRNMIWRPT